MNDWTFKDLLKTPVSLKAIYRCRNMPLILAVVFFLMLNIGFTFPFLVHIAGAKGVSLEWIVPEAAVETQAASGNLEFLKELVLEEGRLVSTKLMDSQVADFEGFSLIYDPDDTGELVNESRLYHMRLTKDYFEIHYGVILYGNYETFSGINFREAAPLTVLDDLLQNSLRATVKQWLLPFGLFIYLAFLSINTFFVVGVSLLALIFRVGDKVKLTYKETLKVVICATAFPVIVAFFVTLFFNMLGVNLILYHLGTFFIYMWVRHKYLKNPKESMV